MERRILLAVDDSQHSKNALKYAVKMSSAVTNLHYVLFTVQPAISQFLLDEAETSTKQKAALNKLVKKNAEASKTFLKKLADDMLTLGIEKKRVEVATQPRLTGLAKDVIDYAEKGNFDAIVVGRRGLSKLHQAFSNSTTANLLEHSRVVPIWMVDGEVTSNRIMLAVDGSESSLRAVDHLGFMIGNNPEVEITLFHVTPKAQDYCVVDFTEKASDLEKLVMEGDKKCIDNFYAHAVNTFNQAGLNEKQLKIKTVEKLFGAGKAIVEEARRGKYGTVIVGRRGANKAFYMGSVSRYVLEKTTNRALWLVS